MNVPIWKTKNLWYPVAIIAISLVLVLLGLVLIGILHAIITTTSVLLEYRKVRNEASRFTWFSNTE